MVLRKLVAELLSYNPSRSLRVVVWTVALELDVQTYPTISLKEALHKFLCPETKILPLFLPDWLASAPIFHRTQFFVEAVSILMFVTHSVFDNHMVAIKSYYLSTNMTLIHRVGLQPG